MGAHQIKGKKEFRYQTLARQLAGQIRDGVYAGGAKLPSVNHLSRKLELSRNTVFRAYVALEEMGLVTAQPKSGYYVKARPEKRPPVNRQLPVYDVYRDLPAMADHTRAAIKNPTFVPFGQATVSPELYPGRKLAKILKSISTREVEQLISYGPIQGNPVLRQQLAERMLGLTDRISPDQILITNGCMEAVTLSLMAVTRPGDTIAVESPTYFGYMQILRELRLSIVEIPTSPQAGLDLDAFETAVDQQKISACLTIPNFQNPLGGIMPDEHKARLIDFTNRRGIPVIEDDVYAELHYGQSRPGLLQAFDRRDQVMTCSSFSKTLSPGLRIGWVMAAPPLLDRIRQIKFSISMMTTSLDQFVLANFMAGNGYDRHLRALRRSLKKQVCQGADAVERFFPRGTATRIPDGGFVLWVRLPDQVDSLTLYKKALAEGIALLPGALCSFSGAFRNHIRISCGFPFNPKIQKGFQRLGNLTRHLMTS